jgi:hypothetical protein
MLCTFVGVSVVAGVSIVAVVHTLIMYNLSVPKTRMSIDRDYSSRDRDYINKNGVLINTRVDREAVDNITVKHNGLECLQDKGYVISINDNFMKRHNAWYTSIKIHNKHGKFIYIRDVLKDCKACNVNSKVSYSYTDALTSGVISKTEVVEWSKCEVPY